MKTLSSAYLFALAQSALSKFFRIKDSIQTFETCAPGVTSLAFELMPSLKTLNLCCTVWDTQAFRAKLGIHTQFSRCVSTDF